MPTVDTIDTGVRAFVYTLWALVTAAFILGAWWLQRTRPGAHRSPYQAVDIGHQPAHAKPERLSWWARALEAWLANAREAATAYALLRGVRLP